MPYNFLSDKLPQKGITIITVELNRWKNADDSSRGLRKNHKHWVLRKVLLKESLRSVFFALKSIAWQQWTSGLNCDDTRWGMNLQFPLFHSSGGGARGGGNKGRKRWGYRGPIAVTSSIHLLNIWLLAALAWYPWKWKFTVEGTWQVKAYWATGKGLWYLSSSDIDRGTLTCPIYHLWAGMAQCLTWLW